MKKAYGFTIVELLIVIVVIAILAAISVVAYTNISHRANDTVVKNDLASFSRYIEVMRADSGQYPAGGYTIPSAAGPNTGSVIAGHSIRFKVGQAAYYSPTPSGSANFIYCTGPVDGTSIQGFAITAQSKSTKMYRQSSFAGIQEFGDTGGAGVPVEWACGGIGYPRTITYGYFSNSGGWQAWAR